MEKVHVKNKRQEGGDARWNVGCVDAVRLDKRVGYRHAVFVGVAVFVAGLVIRCGGGDSGGVGGGALLLLLLLLLLVVVLFLVVLRIAVGVI